VGFARRLWAILTQRCPNCLRGRVFIRVATMLERCPVCGHKFEREEGYFLGAWYASYFLSIPLLGLLTVLVSYFLVPTWRLEFAVLLACVPYLLLTPFVFRYARIIWMHIDPPLGRAVPSSHLDEDRGP
jgi:uncharacterized protein (DUF983 family)